MACKCRDTGCKTCRWVNSWTRNGYDDWGLRVNPRKDRKQFNATFDPFANLDDAIEDATIVYHYHDPDMDNVTVDMLDMLNERWFDIDTDDTPPASELPTDMLYGDTLELWDAEEWTQTGFSVIQVF